eukprot:COSAG01_NODE_44366_length_419_cov_158.890625_1_plen_73_part_10
MISCQSTNPEPLGPSHSVEIRTEVLVLALQIRNLLVLRLNLRLNLLLVIFNPLFLLINHLVLRLNRLVLRRNL